MIRYDIIRYDMIRYDRIWYHTIWYDNIMIWYDIIRYHLIWYDIVWHELIWYEGSEGSEVSETSVVSEMSEGIEVSDMSEASEVSEVSEGEWGEMSKESPSLTLPESSMRLIGPNAFSSSASLSLRCLSNARSDQTNKLLLTPGNRNRERIFRSPFCPAPQSSSTRKTLLMGMSSRMRAATSLVAVSRFPGS